MSDRGYYGRNFICTLQNKTFEDIGNIRDWLQENTNWYVMGQEVAPTTGTKHIHLLFESKERTFLRSLINKQLFDHIEPVKSSIIDAYNYCIKDGDIEEWGTIPYKGITNVKKKNDKVKTMMKEYMELPLKTFIDRYPHFYFYNSKQLEKYKMDTLTASKPWEGDLQQKNWWIWGEPGTGKSKWARSQVEPNQIFLKGANKWWGGYDSYDHKVVLIEDFPNDAKMLGGYMKLWADRYTFTAEIKGTQSYVNPGTYFLIVTSNYSMEECFNEGDLQAIKRRFKEINLTPGSIFVNTVLDPSILSR